MALSTLAVLNWWQLCLRITLIRSEADWNASSYQMRILSNSYPMFSLDLRDWHRSLAFVIFTRHGPPPTLPISTGNFSRSCIIGRGLDSHIDRKSKGEHLNSEVRTPSNFLQVARPTIVSRQWNN